MKRISYKTAVHWRNNALICCNNIGEIDPTIYDNMDYHRDFENTEIYQWFLTDCSKWDKKYLTENFPDLIFTYSEKLDVYVLCVDHWGTSWDYVGVDCPNDTIWRITDKKKDPIKAQYCARFTPKKWRA